MEITIDKVGPCKANVTIVIPPETVNEELNNTYQQTAQTVTFPGFRKGKAPKKLISKRFGDVILEDVKEKLFGKAFSEAIENHNLQPASEPEVDLAAFQLKEGESIEFTFTLETRPEFTLGEYKGLEVTVEPIQVTDKDIDDAIMAIRSRFAFLKTVEDQPVDKKHYITGDLTYKVEGEEDLERKDVQANMSLGILDGVEVDKEIEKLLEKKVDETAEIDIAELPPHFLPENLRGKAAKVEVKIKEIREVAFPDVDDEFLKKINMKDMEELRGTVQKEVESRQEKEHTEITESKIVDRLVEAHDFEVPEKMLMQQISDQENNMKMEMMRLGIPKEKIEEEAGKLDEKNRTAAGRNLKASFLYEAIADKEKIFVTENEIESEMKVIAQQQNMNLQDVQKHYEERQLTSSLKSLLRNQKIRKLLREHAKITEESSGESAVEEKDSAEDSEKESTV